MSELDHYGESTEFDELVKRIRSMDDPERDRDIRMAESRGFDAGYLAGIDHAIQMTRDENRVYRRLLIERLSDTYRTWRRKCIEGWLCGLAIVVVPALALYLISKGG